MGMNPLKADDLKQALKLDLATFVLDMVGVVDPTGTADVASGAISLWRGEWLSAGISFLGVFAGLGDLAKFGKLRKYADSVEKAIDLARRDKGFALEIRESLKGLKGVFDRLPMEHVPEDLRPVVQRIRYQLDNFIADAPPTKAAQTAKVTREVVVASKSLEEARNKAIAWLETQGAVFGPHTAPIPARLYEKRTGRRIGGGIASTKGARWEIRIDFDPGKGPHYNAKFQPEGRPEVKYAFTFPAPSGVHPEQWLNRLRESLGDVSKRALP
jgi:hypothetical protein